MYEFIPIDKPGTGENFQPVDNMKFNGVYLNELVDGYRQLHVSGRSVVSRDVKLIDIPYRKGKWFESVKVEPRIIKVTYQLSANSSDEIRNHYAKLNKHLHTEAPVPIQFDDEPEYTYYGLFESAGDKAEQSLVLINTLTIICPDPTKYRTLNTTTDAQMPSNMEADFVYPKKMVIKPLKATNHIEVSNGKQRIVLKGAYEPSSQITIQWGDEITIDYAGHNELMNLQQFSELEFFRLEPGMHLTGKDCRVASIEWSDERL